MFTIDGDLSFQQPTGSYRPVYFTDQGWTLWNPISSLSQKCGLISFVSLSAPSKIGSSQFGQDKVILLTMFSVNTTLDISSFHINTLNPRGELLEKHIQQWLKILRVWTLLLGAVLPALWGRGRKCYEAPHVRVLPCSPVCVLCHTGTVTKAVQGSSYTVCTLCLNISARDPAVSCKSQITSLQSRSSVGCPIQLEHR